MSTQGGKGILHPSTSPAPTATAETQSPSPEMLLVLCASLKATAEQLIEEQRQLVHSGAEKIGAIDALKSDVEQLEKLEQSLDSELKWTTLRLSLLTVPTSQHSDILAVLSDLDLCNLTADFQSTLRKVQLGQAKVMLCRESTPSVVADGPSNKCLVCWERPKQVFLDPCGHTLCQMCSGILKICPACRAPIERCQPLFL
ncbi:hypothetical protein Pelo_12966 [Pelomyxa schiedti]|nr:hypothetical protein Pelo_12966 [Pelomyxa schiedti]